MRVIYSKYNIYIYIKLRIRVENKYFLSNIYPLIKDFLYYLLSLKKILNKDLI